MMASTTRSLAAVATACALVVGGALSASASGDVDGGIRDTDAPGEVRLGAAVQTVPVTVITDEPVDEVEVSLFSLGADTPLGLGASEQAEPGRPTVHKASVFLLASELTEWNAHDWAFAGFVDGSDEAVALELSPAVVKAHSLAGLRTSRTDGRLRVEGSVRGYHTVLDRYVPLSGRTLSVQRWTGSAWVQTTGVTTDARGNFATSGGQVAAGTPLRVVLQDATTVWGAVSATVRAA